MLIKRLFLICFSSIFFLLAGLSSVHAGFGITPPYVKSSQLIPGSHYQQRILLLRSSAEDDLRAELTVNAPDIKDWITVDKGMSFIMPKGELQVPIIVNVDAPKDAELGNYKGHINIRISPAEERKGGGVAIALGARIDVDLALTNVIFSDFNVRLVSIPDIEMLGKPWNWKYWSALFDKLFYKVRVVTTIQNTGNVETAPSRIHLDLYDIGENRLLESNDDSSLKKVKAFSTEEVIASFPTKVPKGQYWGKIKIYKDNEIVSSYKLAFTVMEPGGLGGKAVALGIWPWLVMGGIIIAALAVLAVFIKIRVWRYAFALIMLVVRPIWGLITSAVRFVNAKFWKWMRKKAEKYDTE